MVMVNICNGKKAMNDFTNSDLIKHILTALFTIASRRTSESYSVMVLTDILKTLEGKFTFLKYVTINGAGHPEREHGVISITLDIDRIDPAEVGRAIESFIRVASMNMKDKDAGLYFITELKDQVEGRYIPDLKRRGVDLDLIQLEQHYLYKQRKRESIPPSSYRKIKPRDKNYSSYASLIKTAWEKVAFWEYNDNICTIYDKKGNVLNRLPLDKIVKDYIVEMTGFEKLPLKTDKLVELNEKEYEFIQLLYSKDMDAEEAMQLLHISRKDLSIIIRKLLVYEILQYVSYDEVILTEMGIKTLTTGKQ